jgi:hypothetical protein
LFLFFIRTHKSGSEYHPQHHEINGHVAYMVRRLEIGYQTPRRRQEIILTIYNKEIRPKGEPWVHLAQDSKKQGVFVVAAISHQVP